MRKPSLRRLSLLALLALLTLVLMAPAQATDAKGIHRGSRHARDQRSGKRHKRRRHRRSSHAASRSKRKPPTGSGSSGNGSSGSGSSGSGSSGSSGGSGSSESSTGSGSSDPFAGIPFYVSGESEAAVTEREWAAQGHTTEAAEIGKIATYAQAEWFGNWSDGHGGTTGDVSWWVGSAVAAGSLPVIVAYDIPWRDCSGYSSGGAASPAAYREFIDEMAAGIAGRRTIVILEPDALAELSCLSSEQQADYYSLLSYAVAKLGESPSVSVYLDAGNATWQPVATIAARLRAAGVAHARGFSLNVSNFGTTAAETAYGEAIVKELGGGHFIIDTSRNGNGPAPGGEWCNPPGRALGSAPTAATGNPLVDAYFWIKRPGESDGTCNGGPSAGTFWPQYALSLAQSASW